MSISISRLHDVPPPSGTPGITIRPLSVGDEDAWYRYLSRPCTIQHTSWRLSSVSDLSALIQGYNTGSPDSSIRFGLFDETGRLIGTIGYNEVCETHKRAELAYDLDPELWGQGIITRACAAVTEWGMSVQGFNRVQAVVLDANRRSARVLEKCGFVQEGILRAYRLVRGEARDFLLFSRIVGRDDVSEHTH